MNPPRQTINDVLHTARAATRQFLPQAALQAVQQGALLIDTRTPTERQQEGVIPGSLHLPRTVLEWCCDPASGYANPAIKGFDQTLIVVCAEGYSASLAALSLKQLGFVNAGNLDGGYRGWKAAGLPTKAPDRAPADELSGMNPPESSGDEMAQASQRFSLRYSLYKLFVRAFQ